MCPTRVSNSATCRISVVTDPNVRCEFIQTVVLDDIFSVSDNLENQHVSTMTEDKCVGTPILSIEFDIEFVRVSIYVFRVDGLFIVEVPRIHTCLFEHVRNPRFSRLNPVTGHIWRTNFQGGQTFPVIQHGDVEGMDDIENRIDVFRLHFLAEPIVHPSNSD